MSLTTRLNIDAIEDGSIPLVKLEEEVAVKSDIPTSVPADGGNSDTVDGKHADDFATANHTHSVINNEFEVTTQTVDGDGIEDYGLLHITNGVVNIESNVIWDESTVTHNYIRLDDYGIDINSNDIVNIDGDTVNIGGDTVNIGGDTVNMGYDQYDGKYPINITDDCIEIHKADTRTDDTTESTIDVDGTISISKNFVIESDDLLDGESIVKLEAKSKFYDDSTAYERDNSAQIVLSAYQYNQSGQHGGSQSNIELFADNISIKSNSNSASNKVFTTNGGVATLPTVPASLKNPHALTIQANGTTIDSYDGSSAKTVNITPASLGLSIVFDYKGVTTTPLSDGSTTKPIVIDGSSYTQKAGDVVIVNGDNDKEFFWNGTKWEELGRSIDLSGYSPANHTHDRFNDLVHFDGAIHICNRSDYDTEYADGEEYETERITGIYFSDAVEDGADSMAYTFIREEGDDRLRIHSNNELKLSTGGHALGIDTSEISGPNIRLISSPDEDNDEDESVSDTIQINAANGVFVNGSEVATKGDKLINPYALTIQKNGTAVGTYDGSSAKTINITVPTIPTSLPANGGNADTVDGKHASDMFVTDRHTSITNYSTVLPKYVDLSTSTSGHADFISLNPGSYNIPKEGHSEMLLHFKGSGSTSALEFFSNYNNNDHLKFRKIIDGNRVSGAWKELAFTSDIPTSLKNPYSLTIQKNGTTVGTYDGSSAKTINITVPTVPTSLPANGGNADTVDGKHAADFMLKSDANAGNWCTPIYISGGKSYTINTIEDTFIRWRNASLLPAGTNLSAMFSPIDLASSAIHSANRFAFGNPDGITIEYSTDGGATWIDYGVGNFEKKSLISGIGFGLNLGKNLSGAGVTANDKLRITLNANAMGVYTQAYALHINVSTDGSVYNGENSIRVDVEKAYRGSETNFTTWLSDLRLQGWTGWNKLPLGGIFFGGGESQTSHTGALRLTFSTSGATEAFPNARPHIIDLQLIGSTIWQTPSNMAKNGHIYNYDANQNVVFPADINTKGDTYTSRLFIKGINSDSVNTTGYITSDSSYNMYISQNGLIPFVVDCSNTSAPSIRAGYSHVNTVSLGTSTVPFKNVYAGGFTKKDSSDNYVLLGGGGHKLTSDFAVANHNHTINLTGTFIPNITSSYNDGVLTILGATTNVQCTGTTDVENTNANPESWFVNPDDMAALF